MRPLACVLILASAFTAARADDPQKQLTAPDPKARRLATEALGKAKAEAAIPALAKALDDPDAAVRAAAVEALMRFGPRAVPTLEVALKSRDRHVRLLAVDGLARFAPATGPVIAALTELLSEQEPAARFRVAQALCRFGPSARPAIKPLVASLTQCTPPEQAAFVGLLIQLGPAAKDAVPALIGYLKPTAGRPPLVEMDLRRKAVDALVSIGPAAKDAVPVLVAALRGPDEWIGGAAAESLGEIGPDARDAVPWLRAMLKPPGRPADEARRCLQWRTAARALGQIGPAAKAAVPDLRPGLTDDDEVVRVWTEFALARLTGEVQPHLDSILQFWGPDPTQPGFGGPVRLHVARALELLGPDARSATDAVLKAVYNEKAQAFVRFRAALALARFGSEATVVPNLLSLLESKGTAAERQFRIKIATEALGQVGPKATAAVPSLRTLLEDHNLEVVEAAAAALRRIEVK